MQYLRWLQVLIALGPKLPAIIAWLQQGYDLLKDLVPASAPPATDSLQMVQAEECAAEVEEAEGKVAELVAGPQAAFDGSRLRALFLFLQSSGLLDVLIKLFAGG